MKRGELRPFTAMQLNTHQKRTTRTITSRPANYSKNVLVNNLS